MKLSILLAAIGVLALSNTALAQSSIDVEVFKSPTCGCCGQWVEHMRQAGFQVTVRNVAETSATRHELGIPDRYGSCHTAKVGDYVIEGHVPAADVKRLLAEKPKAIGLAVPSMVPGSPGMESSNPVAYKTLLVKSDGSSQVFAQH